MNKSNNYYYLLRLEYLGFRYHGWQKQPDVKTVQYMVDRTLNFIFENEKFKTLAASRTDAMVSATDQLIQLTLSLHVETDFLIQQLNLNLPNDLRIKAIEEIDKKFNIINRPKIKEYHYYFSFGEKPHPYCAPFMINYKDDLDIEKMKKCASFFEGTHNFREYCYRPKEGKDFFKEILHCKIEENHYLTANFFPKNSYVLIVKGRGFLHHQIRLMMGTLIKVGTGQLDESHILGSLNGKGEYPAGFIAPASGLHLYKNTLL